MLFQFDYQDQLRKEDHKKKMINLNKIWVKISATMVGRRQKIKKKNTGENALKQSQKYEIWTKIYMIQTLLFGVLL